MLPAPRHGDARAPSPGPNRRLLNADESENRLEVIALTSRFPVELPGIEPDALPGNLPPELPVRSISVQFSTSGYLRFRPGVLTASRAVTTRGVPVSLERNGFVPPDWTKPSHRAGIFVNSRSPHTADGEAGSVRRREPLI